MKAIKENKEYTVTENVSERDLQNSGRVLYSGYKIYGWIRNSKIFKNNIM